MGVCSLTSSQEGSGTALSTVVIFLGFGQTAHMFREMQGLCGQGAKIPAIAAEHMGHARE